jgi:hypothetical protein
MTSKKLSLPTLQPALAVGWNRDITKKASYAVCVGDSATPKGKRYSMSEQKAKATDKSNSSGLNQALAVSWTGLEALAKARQLIIYNDKTTGVVWFGIANAKIQSVGKDAKGNPLYDLIDATPQPTVESVGK